MSTTEGTGDCEGRIVVITAPNDVDVHNSGHLLNMLNASLDGRPAGVVIDLTGTFYLDSSALGVVIDFHKRLQDACIGLALVLQPQSNIMQLVKRTSLDKVFNIEDSVEQAIGVLCPT